MISYIPHAQQRIRQRGTTLEEVEEVLTKGTEESGKRGRKCKAMVFPFASVWQGKYYPQKKVRVIYVEEGADLIVVTVYVYYGRWED
jgi:hypothetical protein